jgi:hypothetical protein
MGLAAASAQQERRKRTALSLPVPGWLPRARLACPIVQISSAMAGGIRCSATRARTTVPVRQRERRNGETRCSLFGWTPADREDRRTAEAAPREGCWLRARCVSVFSARGAGARGACRAGWRLERRRVPVTPHCSILYSSAGPRGTWGVEMTCGTGLRGTQQSVSWAVESLFFLAKLGFSGFRMSMWVSLQKNYTLGNRLSYTMTVRIICS